MKPPKFTCLLSALLQTGHVVFLKSAYILFFTISVSVPIATIWHRTNIGPIYTVILSILILLSSLKIIHLIDDHISRNNINFIGNYFGIISILTCAVGLVVRIIFILSFPVFQYSDAGDYWHLAQQIASSADYISHTSTGVPFYAWRPPGLPLLLAAPVALWGPQPWIPPVTNLVLYVAGCFIAYRVGRFLVDPAGGFAAVVLLASYPGNIAIGSLALTEPVALVLLIGGFWAILRWGHWPAAVAAGVTLGYASLVKPTFLVLGVVLSVFALSVLAKSRKADRRKAAWCGIVAILAFSLVQAPWVYRNYERLGTLVIGSTLGGINFFMANNPGAPSGTTNLDWLSAHPNEVDQNRKSYARGFEWIKQNPLDFLVVSTKRFLRFAGKSSVQMNDAVREKCRCGDDFYRILSWFDTIWWFLCWTLAIYAAVKHRAIYSTKPWAAALFMMITFLFPVHSVFVGVRRHHEPLAGLILLVAMTALSSTFAHRHIADQIEQPDR